MGIRTIRSFGNSRSIDTKKAPGWDMYSEGYLDRTIFSAIRNLGIYIHEHPHLSFSDESV